MTRSEARKTLEAIATEYEAAAFKAESARDEDDPDLALARDAAIEEARLLSADLRAECHAVIAASDRDGSAT